MPHAVIKFLPGRSEEQKRRIAAAVSQAIVDAAEIGEKAVSVSFEEVAQADWMDAVYQPDILDKPDQLYKKPGYGPASSAP